ncbi:MAG: phenylalanine--tRNA ligase subunit alpha [Candidatus Micrarchaeia archaeon]
MHKYEIKVLEFLKNKDFVTLEEVIKNTNLGKDEVNWTIENLINLSLIDVEKKNIISISFTQEGSSYLKKMLPEDELLEKVKSKNSINVKSITENSEKIGLQWCIKKGFVRIKNGVIELTEKGEKEKLPSKESTFFKSLEIHNSKAGKLSDNEKELIKQFTSRGLLDFKEKSIISTIRINKKGEDALKQNFENKIDEVTKDVIKSSDLDSLKFKKYDVSVPVQRQLTSLRHPLRLLINDVKTVFTQMGFTEISGPIVEPSFWVFDSLFVPQDHPARETQDTFHLSNPESIEIDDKDYFNKIKKVNQKSWKIKWNDEEAKSAVLRTQMTSVSVRYISNLVKQITTNPDILLPQKLFTVGRVFRNENLDYKHLTDFYQVDGIIIGKNLTMANLFDTLSTFYKSFDLNVRFKPAYFPFVEPGAEIFTQLDKSGEWLEIGGSGIIRREITGMKRKNLTVLAWGLGIERMLLLKEKSIKSITEFYNNDLGWLRNRTLR